MRFLSSGERAGRDGQVCVEGDDAEYCDGGE